MSGKAGGADDLTGDWLGFYNYPIPHPPTQFEAALRDTGGLITGITTEVVDWADRPGMTLQAVIEGRRDESHVRFTKMYDDLEHAANVVIYEGTIQGDGDEIEGQWTIPGEWSGTFMMMRRRREEVGEEIRIEEEVPIAR